MPELPEVETIVRGLKQRIIGRKIKKIWTDWRKYLRASGGENALRKCVIRKKILKIERRGKNILFSLSDDCMLLVHQKITGHLLFGKWKSVNGKWLSLKSGPLREDKINQYLRLILFFDNNEALGLSDVRRLAKVRFGPTQTIISLPEIKGLGPEPLEPTFYYKNFKALFNNKRGRIKPVLMDQDFISGIGNIYADEALWLARIHPLSRAEKLNEAQLKRLYASIKRILKKALALHGSSIDNYRDVSGRRGGYDVVRYAYQRTGEPCPRCKQPIKRIVVGGRSAHFCPKCQRH
ncbi:bifunctional DNA-formamidopyrimidine glycosylase/DNA-(apurinic or apyrimidinic site) lyase [Candidatus Jorgensenbacteria bacterium]|nr:bifunctional DNA-formamidopyrimidine glycosylase/DNA-(apurinic or apyrimidinic site) lyase [Candidatus Jorgensenbacteria bacterium]